ncbi:MAG: 50S ribosomal protein L24 [Parcubacteria group bacterium]|nr:50S ribosomal protein L24 [Parcubacteria group bacterium]MBI2049079.1 50S ribosomal protein L24 [Parcubacteria group bacterium]
MNIKKGDNVIVITGKDRGKKGKVTQVFPKENRVVVENVNLKKHHQKPRKSGEKGQIISVAAPIDVSNVMIADPKTGTPTRIGMRMEKGKKVRVAKKSGVEI